MCNAFCHQLRCHKEVKDFSTGCWALGKLELCNMRLYTNLNANVGLKNHAIINGKKMYVQLVFLE